ncbi:protein PHYTOCHROME-DEPENDENT LATE-FLOWERING isoform X2 [Lactuca sativa]|uniref:protein PHYTOCHROME-DEPENDENT LATE-FLOWERING isoform X2 n=1 Tax=Lactuca sativa TaxID=4236 RepID=UPI001C68E148|nr:protein PHYTOCHROME-DEPENDENT LATE-FLOWERING isoform X2 [Lactuca sativa]
MAVSFKVSKKGTRFRLKPKPESPSSALDDNHKVDAPPQLPHIQPPSTRKRSVDDTEDDDDIAGILDAEVSFILNIFPDGYTIKNPSEGNIVHQNAIQNDPKLLFPYDRTSENLFAAIECGRLPAYFLDDIPFKFSNGAVVCEVRDYREQGVNGLSTVVTPCITKVSLKMSLNNVVKDMDQFSDSSWTYGDLLEAESRILKALKPILCLDPTPNLNRLCKEPTSLKLNLNIPDIRKKRDEVVTVSENQIQGKLDNVNVPEKRPKTSDSLSLIMPPVHGQKGNEDGKLSSMGNVNKRASSKSNHTSVYTNKKQRISSHMDDINAPESRWKNMPVKQEPVGGTQRHHHGQVVAISGVGFSFNVGKEIDKSVFDRFSKLQMLGARVGPNRKKKNMDGYKRSTSFSIPQLFDCLLNDDDNDNSLKDETCRMPLSMSLVGGSMNVCKTRVLKFVKAGYVSQECGLVPKLRTRLMLSQKTSCGTVAVHYGELDDSDDLAEESLLHTLPNTMLREGHHVEGDHVQGGQPNTSPGLLVKTEIHPILESEQQSSLYHQQHLQISSNPVPHLNSNIHHLGDYKGLPPQLQILHQQQQAQNQKKMMMMMMGMGQLTQEQAAAIMANRMILETKTHVTGGQSGNINGFPVMGRHGIGMNSMQRNPYMNQLHLQSLALPPPSIGMPHHPHTSGRMDL